MSFDYNCTYCGEHLSQEFKEARRPVLYDLLSTLHMDGRRFDILKLRVTQAELLGLINNAKSKGYNSGEISFTDLAGYVLNENNMNLPEYKDLFTLEAVRRYIHGELDTDVVQIQEEKEGDADPFNQDDPFAQQDPFAQVDPFGAVPEKLDEPVVQSEEEKASEAAEKAKAVAEKAAAEAAEQAKREQYAKERTLFAEMIRQKDARSSHETYSEEKLIEELRRLEVMFATNPVFRFEMQILTESAADNTEVITGFNICTPGQKDIRSNSNARVCPHCGNTVFEKAGTAKHRTVVFIGSKRTGKTSTILALSHFLRHYEGDVRNGERIWNSEESRNLRFDSITALSPSARLRSEFNDYSDGYAPQKTTTGALEDAKAAETVATAYSATFLIKAEGGRRTIITLSDIAGEACNEETGHVDIAMLQKEFKTAMTCDAYVLCFDTSDDAEHKEDGIAGTAEMIYNWAKEIQEQRLANCNATGFVPMMVLFTKCKELEDENLNKEARNAEWSELPAYEKIHLFSAEVQRMRATRIRIYRNLSSRIEEMELAYYAQLRCSPYGYAAPARPKGETKPSGRVPKPRNVEKLARWLMYVTGCLPLSLEEPHIERYYVEPPLYRNERADEKVGVQGQIAFLGIPNLKVLTPIAQNAVARCYLFKNPSESDEDYTNHYGEGFNLLTDYKRLRNGRN